MLISREKRTLFECKHLDLTFLIYNSNRFNELIDTNHSYLPPTLTLRSSIPQKLTYRASNSSRTLALKGLIASIKQELFVMNLTSLIASTNPVIPMYVTIILPIWLNSLTTLFRLTIKKKCSALRSIEPHTNNNGWNVVG